MTTAPPPAEQVILDSDETVAAEEEKSKLRKHFGRFDMLCFLICTLVGVDTLGAVANTGRSDSPGSSSWRSSSSCPTRC